MALVEAIREYRFSDAILKQKMDDLIDSVTRDIDDFSTRGIADTTAVQELIDKFDDIPDDSYYRGNVSIATQDRDEAETALKSALRTIRTMAGNKWGESDARYRIYDLGRLSAMIPEKMVRVAKNVAQIATDQLADLASEGLTTDRIDALGTLRTTLDDKIDDKASKVKERDLATQRRINAGNELYKEMVRITNIGKDLYIDTNEAKYNDYVIYNTPTTEAPADTIPTPPATESVATGTVTDQTDGSALAGVTVTAEHNGSVAATTTTDANGSFTMSGLAPGSGYVMRFTISGYEEEALTNVTLPGGEVTVFNVPLMPEA